DRVASRSKIRRQTWIPEQRFDICARIDLQKDQRVSGSTCKRGTADKIGRSVRACAAIGGIHIEGGYVGRVIFRGLPDSRDILRVSEALRAKLHGSTRSA